MNRDELRALQAPLKQRYKDDPAAGAILADWGCDYIQGALVGLATLERPWAVQPKMKANSA